MDSASKDNTFTMVSFLRLLWKWRKLLLIVFIISVVASVGISLLIPNRYESVLVLMPTKTNSMTKIMTTPNYTAKDFLDYGEEKDCEYLIQALTSTTITSKVCDHFKLMEHYNVKDNSTSKLYKKYIENVKIKRTPNLAVEIRVRDKDPKMAYNIAVYINEQYDVLRNEMKEERTRRAFEIIEGMRSKLSQEIRSLEDSLMRIQQQGMMSYEEMTDRIYEQLAKEIANNNQAAIARLQKHIDNMALHSSRYIALREYLYLKTEEMTDLDARYLEAQTDAEQTLPFKFVVDKPYLPDKKIYPKRSVIVLVVTLSSMLLCVVSLLFAERYKGLMKEIKS